MRDVFLSISVVYTRAFAELEVPQPLVLLRVLRPLSAFARRVEQISALGFARLAWGLHEMGVWQISLEHRDPKSMILPEVKR